MPNKIYFKDVPLKNVLNLHEMNLEPSSIDYNSQVEEIKHTLEYKQATLFDEIKLDDLESDVIDNTFYKLEKLKNLFVGVIINGASINKDYLKENDLFVDFEVLNQSTFATINNFEIYRGSLKNYPLINKKALEKAFILNKPLLDSPYNLEVNFNSSGSIFKFTDNIIPSGLEPSLFPTLPQFRKITGFQAFSNPDIDIANSNAIPMSFLLDIKHLKSIDNPTFLNNDYYNCLLAMKGKFTLSINENIDIFLKDNNSMPLDLKDQELFIKDKILTLLIYKYFQDKYEKYKIINSSFPEYLYNTIRIYKNSFNNESLMQYEIINEFNVLEKLQKYFNEV